MILDEETRELVQMVRDFVDKEIIPTVGDYEKNNEFPVELLDKACAMGLNALCVPREYGGPGFSSVQVFSMAEEIARGIREVGGLDALLLDLAAMDPRNAIPALMGAAGILIGTPTLDGDAAEKIWELLTHLPPNAFKGTFASAFGAAEFFDRKAKIDDPVGAVSVHGVCGCLGTLLTGLFATGVSTEKGLFYGGGFHFLGVQALGVAATIAWTGLVITLVFILIKKTIGLRADAADETVGLDRSEHGLLTAYSGFAIIPESSLSEDEPAVIPAASEETAPMPRREREKAPDAPVYTRVQIICRPGSLESLKAAMNKIGITGMTVSNVMGYGAQKGRPEYYRGTPVEVTLLPKVQVDIVVSKVPVRQVIDTARAVLHTGHIGDGKIFVQDVENVVRVRTGEEGYDALQTE